MKSITLILLSLLAITVFGQTNVTLETITVKGTKEEKNYFENPESIVILQENQLPGTGRENNLQVLNAVPNVEVNKNGESFSIRGINNTGVTGFQKDNLSSVVIDDVFQTDLAIQAGSFNLWDMERIEILRGAQSTSQGVNSLAGTILLDHKRAQQAVEGAIKLGAGHFNHQEFGIITNTILVKEKLSSRLSYDKEVDHGYITNKTTDNNKWGGWNKDRAQFDLNYKISDSDVLGFNAKMNRNDQGGTYTQGVDAFQYEVTEDVDYRVLTTNYQGSLNYGKNLSENSKNTAVLAYSQSAQDVSNDADGTALNTAGERIETHKDHYFSFEDRWHYKNENISNVVGIHIHDFKLTDFYDFDLLFPTTPGNSTPVAVTQDVDRIQKAYALFDSITYKLDANQSIVAGLRGEFVESKYGTGVFGQRTRDEGPALNNAIDAYVTSISGAYEGSNSSFVVLPKIGYGYQVERNFAALTYTRGYRAAGVGINRRRATAHEYDPEYTNNYELSYKYAGEEFQFSSNGFFIDWRDQQVQAQLSSDTYDTQVMNAAKSELYGAEVEGKYKLQANQDLSLGVGYTDTKFRDFKSRTRSYEGNKFPYASNWTSRLAYELKPTDNLSFLTVVRYVSEAYTNAENTREAEGQFYLNLNSKYAIESWVIEAYVNNVFDGQYRIFDGRPTSTTSPYQARYNQASTPREFGARLNYFW